MISPKVHQQTTVVRLSDHQTVSQINVEPSRGPSPRRRHPRVDVSHFPPDVVEPWGSSHGELSRSPHSPGNPSGGYRQVSFRKMK
ncbi:jg21656 [Pararge aegeria aegeria]|uniref:Jg21656 protein n=1 Tax=Pararge aegeria aegeria TaxID=348720 RepID=A0A8S4RL72_9NEOP|nr:jg21656 [Pararge aegeria aegeria]